MRKGRFSEEQIIGILKERGPGPTSRSASGRDALAIRLS